MMFCQFRNVLGRGPMSHILEDYILLCSIQWATLDLLWRQRPRTVKNNFMTLKGIHEVGDEVLGILEGLTDMGPLPLRDEIGMVVACTILILSTRKGNYSGHLQWYIIRKSPTELSNIYKAVYCGSWGDIFAKDDRNW